VDLLGKPRSLGFLGLDDPHPDPGEAGLPGSPARSGFGGQVVPAGRSEISVVSPRSRNSQRIEAVQRDLDPAQVRAAPGQVVAQQLERGAQRADSIDVDDGPGREPRSWVVGERLGSQPVDRAALQRIELVAQLLPAGELLGVGLAIRVAHASKRVRAKTDGRLGLGVKGVERPARVRAQRRPSAPSIRVGFTGRPPGRRACRQGRGGGVGRGERQFAKAGGSWLAAVERGGVAALVAAVDDDSACRGTPPRGWRRSLPTHRGAQGGDPRVSASQIGKFVMTGCWASNGRGVAQRDGQRGVVRLVSRDPAPNDGRVASENRTAPKTSAPGPASDRPGPAPPDAHGGDEPVEGHQAGHDQQDVDRAGRVEERAPGRRDREDQVVITKARALKTTSAATRARVRTRQGRQPDDRDGIPADQTLKRLWAKPISRSSSSRGQPAAR